MKLNLYFIKSVTVFLAITVKAVNASFLNLLARKSRDSPEKCFPRQCATNLSQYKLVARRNNKCWQDILILLPFFFPPKKPLIRLTVSFPSYSLKTFVLLFSI